MTNETTASIITEAAETVEITETIEEVGVETFPPDNNQFENMIHTLPMMGKGMLGIFLVTVIIIISVVILNKATNIKKKD